MRPPPFWDLRQSLRTTPLAPSRPQIALRARIFPVGRCTGRFCWCWPEMPRRIVLRTLLDVTIFSGPGGERTQEGRRLPSDERLAVPTSEHVRIQTCQDANRPPGGVTIPCRVPRRAGQAVPRQKESPHRIDPERAQGISADEHPVLASEIRDVARRVTRRGDAFPPG